MAQSHYKVPTKKKSGFIILWVFILSACTQPNEFTPNFGMRTITKFEVQPANNPANISVSHIGIINEQNRTITISLPKSADLSNIKPTIQVAPYASVSPASLESVDMSDTIEYVVTAQNGKKAYYTLICKKDFLYSGATLMYVTLKNVLDNEVPIQIRFDKSTAMYELPTDTDLSNIQIEVSPDPYSQHATYYVNNKVTDFSEPIDFNQYPNGLPIMVIAENSRNFSAYTIKLAKKQ